MSATSLHTVYDYFPAMMAEVGGCERGPCGSQSSQIFTVWNLSQKSLLMSSSGGLALGWLLLSPS